MVFGRSPRLPVVVPINEEQINSPTRVEAAQHLRQLQLALQYARSYVDERTTQRRQRMTDNFNRQRGPLRLKVGDHIYISHPYSRKPKKLDPRALGPYKVSKVTQHPVTKDVVSVEVDVTPPGSDEKKYKYIPRRRIRPIHSRLPTIDWKTWPDEEAKDLAELLEIKEPANAPPAYVAFEDPPEDSHLREDYLFDIIEIQPETSKMGNYIPTTALNAQVCVSMMIQSRS